MGIHRVRMPQLGESIEEGTVVAWLIRPGTEVDRGEALLEISTDKVDSDVEATVSGVLRRILVEEGETVAVGAVLGEIEVEGAGEIEEADTEAGAAPGGATGAPADVDVDRAPPVADIPSRPGAASAATPAAARSGPADLEVSPVVRRLVAEHGIDLDELAAFAGSARLNRKDVEAYLAQRGGPPADGADGHAVDADRVVPFSRIRRLTAERMVASKATSAHVVTAVEVDFEAVARLRAEHRDRVHAERGVRLTWLPFVACAVARTLGGFARLNATVRDGEALVVRRGVHLGIAVDLDGEGLVVPVIRDAADLSLLELAERIGDLADRARRKALTAGDVEGGTFTITGQGPHGTLFTAPIINQPQVAILSVDGIAKRPVVVQRDGDDEIVAHHTGVLALSWDHRAVDGTYAAGFLAAVRSAIEDTDWAAELR